MSQRYHLLRTALLAILFTALVSNPSLSKHATASSGGSIPLPAGNSPIYLLAGTFVPGAGETPPGADEAQVQPDDRPAPYVVQFAGPIQESWKAAAEKLGATVLDYVPDFAFVMFMTPAVRDAVSELPEVAWIGGYLPAFRVSPALAGAKGMTDLVVQTFPVTSAAAVAAEIRAQGLSVDEVNPDPSGGLLRMRIDVSRIPVLSRIPEVRWIEPYYERVAYNDVSRSASEMDAATVWSELGLYGDGQVVAVADTGLDTGNLTTLHQDFLGAPTGCSGTDRIVATFALGRQDTGDWSDSCSSSTTPAGHGTHVAGSVLGNGCMSGSSGTADYAGSYAGLAPQAGLVFQSVMNTSCALGGIPSDLNTLFSQAQGAGAQIHTDSWGASYAGAYTTDSRNVDVYSWNHRDFTILFSAGNDGVDTSPADGFVDADSIGSPGTAKNAITVGATENYRPASGATGTWGAYWPTDFPTAPISTDHVSDNATGMAAFSSRGPTNDGRIKPDVVAPGTNILSTKSQGTYVSGGWGAGPSPYYMYMGGTSMSTPLTAGAVALIRQYYTDVQGIPPSAALLKATLINSATDLYPGQYASPVEQNPHLPNYAQGWGRVDVADAAASSRQYQDLTDAAGVATGGSGTITYEVCNATELNATLVWTDYPAATTASVSLVNDLDLTVTAPDGTTVYKGNVFTDGWSSTGGSADRRNNVESVYLQNPTAGTWTVTVSGYNVPSGTSGKQGYALVVDLPDNACAGLAVEVTPASQNVCSGSDAVYTVDVTGLNGFTDPTTLSLAGAPAGTDSSFVPNPVTPTGQSSLTIGNTGAAFAGSYPLTVTATSGTLVEQAPFGLSVSSAAPATPTIAAPANGAIGWLPSDPLTWDAAAQAATYDVQVSSDPGFTSIVASATGLTGTSYTPDPALAEGTAYYWRVRAVNGCGASAYSALAALTTATIGVDGFCRTPSVAIPDANPTGVTDNMAVVSTGSIIDLSASVRATHTWVGDLTFTLTGAGASAVIIERPGVPQISNYGCSQNHINATLEDGAALPVEDQCASSTASTPPPYAIDGTFTPNNTLSNFAGHALSGTWQLKAVDNASPDTGTLTSWCITATHTTTAAADYGDLAATYGAAWHTGTGALRLGTGWSADASFAPAVDSATDDGVTFPFTLTAGAPGTVRVTVQGTPTAGRWLRLWFDWNNDGAFDAVDRAYDGAVTDGVNDLDVDIPAFITGMPAYRARLYDSAASPTMARIAAAEDASMGGVDGGEVEDGNSREISAPLTAMGLVTPAAVDTEIALSWDAVVGAVHYEVWRAADAPYFTAGSDCSTPAPYTCATVTVTSYADNVLADLSHNYTYRVRAVGSTGAVSDPSPSVVGDWGFALVQ